MATRFYYPAHMRRANEYLSFLRKHQADMVRLNNITDPQLSELNTLNAALTTICTSGHWPKYQEQP